MEALTLWRPAANALRRFILPAHCLLCSAPGADGLDLCHHCAAELPRNRHCCARCALPLPESTALCGQCQRKAPPWDAAWVPFRYGWPLDRLESRYKFGADLAAGRALSTLWLREPGPVTRPQLIVPVPLHRARLRERGYNQAVELARPIAQSLRLPLRHDLLQRSHATHAQTDLGAVARRRNVRDAFSVRNGITLPAHIALLDDVMTTGATLAECARTLRRAGVRRVDIWALARAPVGRS